MTRKTALMLQTRLKDSRDCPKMSKIVLKCPKMSNSDASLSERTCLFLHPLNDSGSLPQSKAFNRVDKIVRTIIILLVRWYKTTAFRPKKAEFLNYLTSTNIQNYHDPLGT